MKLTEQRNGINRRLLRRNHKPDYTRPYRCTHDGRATTLALLSIVGHSKLRAETVPYTGVQNEHKTQQI